MIPLPRLYGIADAAFGDPVRIANCLFRGGARVVQIRNKRASARTLFRQTTQVLSTAPQSAWVIVNDRADVARLSGAAGVHLGQEDLPPWAARKVLHSRSLIGRSTHSLPQAEASNLEPVDYVAVGPVFPTSTKRNASKPLGLEGLARICRRVNRPVVAIGGIRLEHLPEVLKAGAASVAVIRDLIGGDDIEGRTRRFIERLEDV